MDRNGRRLGRAGAREEERVNSPSPCPLPLGGGEGIAATPSPSERERGGVRVPSDNVDPITLEVVCEGLIAIVREMRATVIRASYSPVIWELDDFSCALTGPTSAG
ncbi:MAG: hypothetical protein DMD86_03910 [Candidatus Rokuibacteriota bacterium]|nr:MAG: hypothetical protein DMD86_03910 [Candidatus Rokubacteria bacterium]